MAIEFFFADGQVVFLTVLKEERSKVLELIAGHCPPQAIASGSLTIQGAGLLGMGEVSKLELMKEKWLSREISNFDCERGPLGSPDPEDDSDAVKRL